MYENPSVSKCGCNFYILKLYIKFIYFIIDKCTLKVYYICNGKPVEKQGHKAKGLRSEDYDSRLPHDICVWMEYVCKYNNVQPFMLGINGFLSLRKEPRIKK